MRDFGEVEFAALLHRGEQTVEIALGILRFLRAALEELGKEAVGQELDAVREETEHELVDEMSDILRRIAALQT